jgi:23S rRNA pseudouridine1911/1915/1917 synthase
LDEILELTVPEQAAGERVDRVAADLAGGRLTRTQVRGLIDEGDLVVDGRKVRPSAKARPGQVITLVLPPPPVSTVVAQDIPIDVVFEDEHLMVVDKPAGQVVHPAAGNPDGTLANALMYHRGIDCGEPGRPGIVHRLDKDTSGLMLVAKTEPALRALSAMIARRHVTREYLALVRGCPRSALTIRTPYGRHPRDRKRFTSRGEGGVRAVTRVELVSVLAAGGAAEVRCVLETGRTHQIRVHMSESGFPLIGDPVYSRLPRKGPLRGVCERAGRTMLHAARLELTHPQTGAWLTLTREPPGDFQGVRSELARIC